MRNLKRVLSLALAVMMLIGMMVVGANAAGYNDFTDKDEIENKDAVSMLVSLGIINGMEDGSYFAPTQGVDRAQMAKMISVIMNLGIDKGDLYENTPTGLTDISNSWAKGHINFCYTTGIIAGRGNNTFDPNTGVTGTEAAKMLLVAAGYDPAVEGLTGAQWQTKTIALASKLGIFRNYTKPVTDKLSRDDAALLIYNALDIEMIQKYEDGYALSYADHRTILSAMYGVYKVEGVVVANEWAMLDDDSDTALKEGLTTIYNADGIFSTTTSTSVNDKDNNVKTATFEVSTPVDMLGKTVTLYVKKATILENSTVYGEAIVAAGNNVITTGNKVTGGTTRDDNSLASLLKGTGLSVDKNTEYYHNYEEVALDSTKTADVMNVKGATLTVIDNDNDGYVEYVLSLEKTLSEISSYNTSKETLTVKGMITEDFANVVGYEDVAKDDIVLAVTYGGRTYVEKPETVTGEMEYYTTKVVTDKYMTVDGTDYYEDGLTNKSGATKFKVDECEMPGGVQFDATYIFYLDEYDNVIAFEEVEAAAKNYALITDSAFSVNGLTLTAEVELLLSDGTTGTYDVNWTATRNNLFGKNGDESLKNFFGTSDGRYQANGYRPAGSAAGVLVTYSFNEDNEVTLGEPDVNLSARTKSSPTLITSYTASNYDTSNVATLDAAISKGDTYFEVDGNGTNYVYSYVDSNKDVQEKPVDVNSDVKFGIDDETVVFFWDGSNANVAIGYENLYNTENFTSGSSHKVDVVMYNPEAYDNGKTGVANVIVVHGDYDAEKETHYALVLDTYRQYSTYNVYNVILEDGTITTLKTETPNTMTDGVNNMVYEYSTDSKGWTTFTSVFTGDADKNEYLMDGNKVLTTVNDVDLDSSGDPVHNIAFGYVYVPYAKWVETYHAYGTSTPKAVAWDAMLADRNADVIFNAFDVDKDDETADTIAFENGQQAVIVYDKDLRVKCAWVIADKDDDIVIPGDTQNDRITSTTVNGFKTRSAGDYATISKAVANATPLPLSADQAGQATATVVLTFDSAVDAYRSGKFIDSDMAKDATDADLTTSMSTTVANGALNDGNVIVVKTYDSATKVAMYSAYIVEIQ
ncbi:S-layer homology domain-containing protein [uncultured Flavonifractor sp.]|uniref:S-layer homology domain-containing protein n=1 Tax=uncultured Flavonifractor sp. TaxID=1193534 RepID=UPI00260799AD|nr:S-layer homology domain-containing protein [uncultured Flavonifractor sp.]